MNSPFLPRIRRFPRRMLWRPTLLLVVLVGFHVGGVCWVAKPFDAAHQCGCGTACNPQSCCCSGDEEPGLTSPAFSDACAPAAKGVTLTLLRALPVTLPEAPQAATFKVAHGFVAYLQNPQLGFARLPEKVPLNAFFGS